jgi:hypothetical protein
MRYATLISFTQILPNVVVKWLKHMFRIREVPGSYPAQETGYRDWDFSVFPQSLQAIPRVLSPKT